MDEYRCRICREAGDGNLHHNPEFDRAHHFEVGYDDDPCGSCGHASSVTTHGEDCAMTGCDCTWFDTIGDGEPSAAVLSETRNVEGIDGEGGWF